MIFYISIVLLISLFAFLDFFNISIANKVMFFLISLILIFISGFRYGLDTDYWSYWKIFHDMSKMSIEPGYTFISDIIKVFTKNFNYFLVCIAILSIGVKNKILLKVRYPFIALLMFFLRFFVFFELNVIRQGLATAFLLVAIYFLTKENKTKAFIFMLLASTLHISSIVFILAFFVTKIHWDLKKITIYSIIFIFFRLYILVPLIDFFSFLGGKGNDFIVKGTKYLLQSSTPSMSGTVLSVIRILLPVLCIYFLGIDKRNKIYFNLFITGAFINIAFMGMDTIAYRVAMIFYSTEGLAVSESIKQRNLKTIILLGIIFILNFISFYKSIEASSFAIPYTNYLFVDPNTLRI